MVALVTVPVVRTVGHLYSTSDTALAGMDFFASIWNYRKCHFRKVERWSPPTRLLPACVEVQEMRGARIALLIRCDRVEAYKQTKLRSLNSRLVAQIMRVKKDALKAQLGLRAELAVCEKRIWRLLESIRVLQVRSRRVVGWVSYIVLGSWQEDDSSCYVLFLASGIHKHIHMP